MKVRLIILITCIVNEPNKIKKIEHEKKGQESEIANYNEGLETTN